MPKMIPDEDPASPGGIKLLVWRQRCMYVWHEFELAAKAEQAGVNEHVCKRFAWLFCLHLCGALS